MVFLTPLQNVHLVCYCQSRRRSVSTRSECFANCSEVQYAVDMPSVPNTYNFVPEIYPQACATISHPLHDSATHVSSIVCQGSDVIDDNLNDGTSVTQ